jgi:tellurite methyltransferase
MTDWDHEYTTTPNLFGSNPVPILVRHLDLLNGNLPILDVGCGQGRNTLYLARHGHTVRALDPSMEALRQTRSAADAEGLTIQSQCGVLVEIVRPANGFSAILAFGLIPILTRAEIHETVALIEDLIAPGGHTIITAFTTSDPKFGTHAREWFEVGRNSFQSPEGDIRTYLEPGELVGLFPEWQVVDHWEGFGSEHRHGDGPTERHGLAEAVLRR